MRNVPSASCSLLLMLLLCSLLSTNSRAGNDRRETKGKSIYTYMDTMVVKKDSSDTARIVKHRSFTPGLAYASNNTFMGRKDSVTRFLLTPSFSYDGKYGFSASISASHADVPQSTTKKGKATRVPVFDEYDIGAGYDHDWNDKFSSSLLETHNFYDAKSARLRSTIDNDLTLGSSFDGKYITALVTGDWAHGKKTTYGQSKDYFYTFHLSHSFDFEKIFHSAWEFDVEPKVDAVYGTQNFYSIYTKGKSLDSTKVNAIQNQKQLKKYNLLNYEFKLITTFTNDKWTLSPEWDYEVPQNVPAGAPSAPFSVFSVSLTYTFKTKK